MNYDERWPDYTIVATELKRLRAEKRVAAFIDKTKYYSEFRRRMRDDYDYERISRRISMRPFTTRMLAIGERIANELENGRASTN
jgi:hypothetical protein